MFRPSDQRRVQALFDAELYAPYEAEVKLEDYRATMRVIVKDPDDNARTIAQAVWWFDPVALKNSKQPRDDEVKQIATDFLNACDAYPARKAAETIETAEKEARRGANVEARAKDRADAEDKLRKVMARALDTDRISPNLADKIEEAASNPALD